MQKDSQIKQSRSKQDLSLSMKVLDNQTLEQLCNPHSVNLKQLKENLKQFTQLLAKNRIISQQRKLEIESIISNHKTQYKFLNEQQTINLVKWQLTLEFFLNYSQYITQASQISQKRNQPSQNYSAFYEVYQIFIHRFSNNFQGKKQNPNNDWEVSNTLSNFTLRKQFIYLSFQILACIFDMNLVLYSIKTKNQEVEIYTIKNEQPIRNREKIFYFLDVGEILQTGQFWNEVQSQFKKQITLETGSQPISNKELLKYLYLGLSIESLQFESVSGSLRFSSELLGFLLSENQKMIQNRIDSQKNVEKRKQKSLLILVSHLNKIIYFLRVLKRNQQSLHSIPGSSHDTIGSSESTPMSSQKGINSKRSLLSRPLNSSKMIESFQVTEKQIHSNLDDENVILNLLMEKTQKLINNLSSRFKEFAKIADEINLSYDILTQIVQNKNPSSIGSDYLSSYSLKRLKSIKFSQQEKKIFFVFLAQQLKNIYLKTQKDCPKLLENCKNIFLHVECNKKIQNQLQVKKNQNIMTQLMQQFTSNLKMEYDSIQKNSKNVQFKTRNNLFSNSPKFKREKRETKQSYKDIYFPSLKPKINLQVQNRLKLKQIKKEQIDKLDNDFFFQENKEKEKFTTNKVEFSQGNMIGQGPSIISTKKLQKEFQSLFNKKSKQNSSLPSKLKISTNYITKDRADNIKIYESTKKSIMDKKFSYEMIVCKRQKGDSLDKCNFRNLNVLRSTDQTNLKSISLGRSHVFQSSIQKKKSQVQGQQSNNFFHRNNELKNLRQVLQKSRLQQKIQNRIFPSKLDSKVIERLEEEDKKIKRNRRQSLVLKDSIERIRRISLNKETKQAFPSQLQPQSSSGSENKKNEMKLNNVFVKSLQTILENCKNSQMTNSTRGRLKLGNPNKNSQGKGKTYLNQDNSSISQKQQKNLQNFDKEGASQTVQSLAVYLKGYLQFQRYGQIVEQKFPLYLYLDTINSYMENKQPFIFLNYMLVVKRRETIKKSAKQLKDRYWSTFRLFLQIDDKIIIIEIEERYFHFQNKGFRDYFKGKIQSSLSSHHLSFSNQSFRYHIIGDLAGILDHYTVTPIPCYFNQQNQCPQLSITNCMQQGLKHSPLLQKCYHNPDIVQILGLKRQKNTVDRVDLFVTQEFKMKSKLKNIPNFLKTLLLNPLNQYVADQNANHVPSTLGFHQESERNVQLFPKEDRKLYHIYFLNRSYEKNSKFKHIIKKYDGKHPSFFIKEFQKSTSLLSQQEKEFSQTVELVEYTCRNLVYSKKYIFFSIKLLKVNSQGLWKYYLMIQQKNFNYGDNRLIFLVLHLRNHLSRQTETSRQKNYQRMHRKENNQVLQIYHSLLINQIERFHSLKSVCDFLITNEITEISSWTDTMFNKMLLTHPHVTVIKKVYLQNDQNQKQFSSDLSSQQKKSFSSNLDIESRRHFVYATIKVFIFNQNNLVIGLIEISGQSFFFLCSFQQLNRKNPRKNKLMSKKVLQKISTSNILKNQLKIKKVNQQIENQPTRQEISSKKLIRLSLKQFLDNDKDMSYESKKTSQNIPSTRKGMKSTPYSIKSQQEMIRIKQKLILILKWGTQLTLGYNNEKVINQKQKSMAFDNYVSRYKMNLKIQGVPIRTTQCKYYWLDVVPNTCRRCVNFRLRDDSLLLIKLNCNGYYMQKYSKIKTYYNENYLKVVADNALKNKGNTINSIIKNKDKFIYYDAYQLLVKDLDQFYYTFSADKNLLLKVKLGITKKNNYQVSAIGSDIEQLIDSTTMPHQDKEQIKQIQKFEVRSEDLSIIHIQNLPLDNKILNNKKFRKRLHSIIQDKLDSIFRRY